MLYRLSDVHVSFAGRTVLRGITLQHNPGEKLVLVGRNGSGKSTLLKVISGELEPDPGTVERARGVEFSRLEQILTADPETPVLRYCLEAIPRVLLLEREIGDAANRLQDGGGELELQRLTELQEEMERIDGFTARPRAETMLQGLGIARELHERPLCELSGGQRSRVALARALLAPGVLLLDEPTNHLDLLGVDFLGRELAAANRAMVVVTHDRSLVDRIAGPILEVQSGRIERFGAGYGRYRAEREERRRLAAKAYALQSAEIRRQEEFIRRNMAGQKTKQAQSHQKLLDRVVRLEAPVADAPAVRLRWPATGRGGDRVLELDRLTVGWDVPIIEHLTLTVRRGERVALVGRNGAGKSTLMRVLAGRMEPLSGSVRFGSGAVPGWYDQEQAEVLSGGSVLDVLLAARPDWTPAEARGWAGRFAFSGEAADADTSSLSGGERARLSLARLLAQGPNLLLLDEPTNHLDVATCEALEEALRDFPGAVILVSHDRVLLERVTTSVVLLADGRAEGVDRLSEAFERIGLATSGGGAGEGAAGATAPRRSAAEEERRRLRRDAARARTAANDLASALEAAESRLAEIEALLCERAVFSDPERARDLGDEADTLRDRIEAQFERWTEAEEDASALEARLADLESE